MELMIQGRNLELTPRLQNYVEKKTARLDRFMPNLTEVKVDLSAENTRSAVDSQVAQITVRDNRGMILRAEERSNDMFAAVDAVVDKLYRQINRYRGKKKRKWRQNESAEEFMGEPLPLDEVEESEEAKIVRTKQFSLKPMTEEEAIDQLELLGHDFYVFFNADSNAVNVLYRRHDNNYGLLQPVLD
ncbi:MAG: ribosome-associated translation inhibitor RaiA [Anaerolineae bacterium]|nr:ribosome-associated translation inhibitor RaiA [Anaerolineae bacterium]